jgi:hypothetical protein
VLFVHMKLKILHYITVFSTKRKKFYINLSYAYKSYGYFTALFFVPEEKASFSRFNQLLNACKTWELNGFIFCCDAL